MLANSDIITFHCYRDRQVTLKMIEDLSRHGRPVICTEWMNRLRDGMKFLRKTILCLACGTSLSVFLWGCISFEQTADIALYAVPWGIAIARSVFTSNGSFTTIGFFLLAFAGAKYWSFLVRTFRTKGMLSHVLIGFHLVGVLVQLVSSRCYHTYHSLPIDCLTMFSFYLFLLFLKESVKRRSH